MCLGENLAPLAIHYLNSQLSGLYDNAVHCVRHHDDASLPENAYAHALAQFSYGEAMGHDTGVQFSITLDKPTLDFVCNHDAILRLRIKHGHFTQHEDKILRDHYHDLNNVTITLRIPFDIRKIVGGDEKIGSGQELLIPLLILNTMNSKTVSYEPEIQQGKESFDNYIKRYLECLYSAGNHVMFSLPDFDDKDGHPSIDYALLEHKLFWPVETINDISVAEVNKQLSNKWLKAAMISSGPVDVFEASWREAVLAEYHSFRVAREDVEFHYHIKFGAPHIEALCSKEVVMYFRLDELFYYNGPDFSVPETGRFRGWEIAVVFDVVHTITAEGNVTTLELTHPRLFQHLCTFEGIEMHNEVHAGYHRAIRYFFSTEYLDLLHSADGLKIYYHDKRWPTTPRPPVLPHKPSIDEEIPTDEVIANTDMDDFDQVTMISQESINLHFSTLWSNAQGHLADEYACALVKRWVYGEEFSVQFQPLFVRFLSDNKAVVWVHLSHAVLRAQEHAEAWRSKDYEIIDWRLAFEVDIRLDQVDDYSKWKVSEEWGKRFRSTHLWKVHGASSDCVLKHIWLDFENARFLHEFSSIENLYDARDGLSSIGKLLAVLSHIQQHYFPALSSWGVNILYSVPVWQPGTKPPSYGLTYVTFDMYSQSVVTHQTWAQVTAGYEPILVILGMSGFRHPPTPPRKLAYSDAWRHLGNRGGAHAKVAISKRVFVQERLLALLSRVNAETTLIPKIDDILDDGKGGRDRGTIVWTQDEKRKDLPAPGFCLVKPENGYLIYKYQDVWTYGHQRLSDQMNGGYIVRRETTNYVEIPASFRRGTLEIKVHGQIALETKCNKASKEYIASAAAQWDATLALLTDVGGGVKVSVSGSRKLLTTQTVRDGDEASSMFRDPQELLQYYLTAPVDLKSVEQDLKRFEGMWAAGYPRLQGYTLANPMFNAQGDILFDLCILMSSLMPTTSKIADGSGGNGAIPSGTATSPHEETTPSEDQSEE